MYKNLYLWEVGFGLEMEPFGLYAIYIHICVYVCIYMFIYIKHIYKAKIINDTLI